MATADIHQGQQAAFQLEPHQDHQLYKQASLHNHYRKADHSHHQMSSSKKQRRDLQQTPWDIFSAPQNLFPSDDQLAGTVKAVTDRNTKMNPPRKNVNLRHGKENHSYHHKKASTHHKHNKRSLADQGEIKELHRKYSKRAIADAVAEADKDGEDAELAFHRRISRNRKTRVLGMSKEDYKKQKRDVFRTQDIKYTSPSHKGKSAQNKHHKN
ncbi:hypothetical protein EDD11_003430 [Mortierella claussenii]|nr:hypothetical protein EDD11_003430 [Mortierella claussenii]